MILRIKEILRERRLTVKWLAEQIGINRVTMVNIANGKNNPSFDTLVKTADVLKVPLWQMFASPEQVRSSRGLIAFIHYGGKSHIPTTLEEVMAVLKEFDERGFHKLCHTLSFQRIRELYAGDKKVAESVDDLCALVECRRSNEEEKGGEE